MSGEAALAALARLERHGSLAAGILLAGLVLYTFGEFLFGGEASIPSHPTGDTAMYFVAARDFAIEQILRGNLPLWNPHTFSGTPFVGVFQSSTLYLPNAIHLVLPPALAFSLEFALHVFLLGLFVAMWLRSHGLHWTAAAFAAVSAMFGSTCILRVLAGQLTLLATFAWVPLLLLSIDRLARRPGLEWTLVGVLAATAMLLAGHPPTFMMAGIATALYCFPVVLAARRRIELVACLACIAVTPLLLAAVQLWPGLQVAAESVRGGSSSYEFATSFSMPPENLLTLVAPGFFGDGPGAEYYGRWWYWDASLYVGCVAFVLAIHGALSSRAPFRSRALALAIVFTLIALGRYTPIYALLYELVPGLAFLRAPSKFQVFASLFAAALVGLGADRLLAEPAGARRTSTVIAVLGLGCGLLALWQWGARWGAPFSVTPTELLGQLEGPRIAAARALEGWDAAARRALLAAVVVLAGSALLLRLAPRRRWAGLLLLGAGTVELVVFAQANHGTTPHTGGIDRTGLLHDAYERAGARRVFESRRATNTALLARGHGIWGYDPMVLRRYGEFIAFTQGLRVTDLDNNRGWRPHRFHPLLSMLRVGVEVRRRELVERPEPLPRALLVRDHRVVSDPQAVLAALAEPGFDPRRSVVLEEEPEPPPVAGGGDGTIRVSDLSTDRLRVEAELDAPAILVVTDAYASGWRAVPLEGRAQREYRVLRANGVLRAVPLGAGRHSFDLVYAPLGFRAGAWVSGLSLALLLAAVGACLWRRWVAGSPRTHSPATSLTLVAAILVAGSSLTGCDANTRRPNILLYAVDTLRADSLEPYGNPVVRTPAAARLAREGVRYERAYAHSSWTRPSIASILTGQTPDVHGVEARYDRAPSSLRFLAEVLAEAGYATAAVVTNPNVGAFFGFDQGYGDFIELFDHVGGGVVASGSTRASSDAVTSRAVAWLEAAKEPFFLFLLTTDPHPPYRPPKRFDRYAPTADKRPRGPAYRRLPGVERQRARYYGEIAFNDASLAQLLGHVEAAGLLDHTVVILTSDHGEEFGEHGYRWHGRTLFEEVVSVPLIVRRPGERRPGLRISTPVQLVDLFPTVLAFAGLPVPDGLAGSVLPPWGREEPRSIYARLELDGYSSQMLVVPPWKWIESTAQPPSDARSLGGLFDLRWDPFEAKNRAAERPDVAESLQRELEDRAQRNAARSEEALPPDEKQLPRELPAELRDALEALGYLETEASDPPRAE